MKYISSVFSAKELTDKSIALARDLNNAIASLFTCQKQDNELPFKKSGDSSLNFYCLSAYLALSASRYLGISQDRFLWNELIANAISDGFRHLVLEDNANRCDPIFANKSEISCILLALGE